MSHRSLSWSVEATERWPSSAFLPGCFRASDTSEPGPPLGLGGTVGSEQTETRRWEVYHPSRVLDPERALPSSRLSHWPVLIPSASSAPRARECSLLCAPVSSPHRLEQKPLFSSLFRLTASMRLGKAVVFRACVEANRAQAPEMWPPPGGLCVLVPSLSEGAGRQDCGRLQTRVSRKSALSGPVGEGGLPTGWLLHFRLGGPVLIPASPCVMAWSSGSPDSQEGLCPWPSPPFTPALRLP